MDRYRAHAAGGYVFGISRSGICLGGGRCLGRRCPQRYFCPGGYQLAEICAACAQQELPYMQAVRMAGSSPLKIIRKHVLPNIAGPILVTAMLDIGTMMIELAGLSFLGLGAKPPIPEWGSMMSDTRNLLATQPWVTLAPGFAIFLSVMIFNLLGDTVRDWLDPKNRR